jgi:acetolactate decarboxylase
MNKSWNKTVENIDAKILGFYSTKHHAIFTHHSTNSHMHFYHELSGLFGHVDELVLSEKVILQIPK